MFKMKVRLYLLFITLLFVGIGCYAQDGSPRLGCNLDSIRKVFIANGCIELKKCITGCSMYFFNPRSMTGDEAQKFAQGFGANLISVQSKQENDCIVAELNEKNLSGVIWIGLNDTKVEGKFEWYDASPVTFTNWDTINSKEPNNGGGNEDCVQIFANGYWNDLDCNSGNAKSIIEVNLCPVIKVNPTKAKICYGDTTTLNTDIILGSFPYQTSWMSTPTGFSSNEKNPVVSPKINTSYQVGVIDRYGCVAATKTPTSIQVDTQKLNISIVGPQVVCEGQKVQLKASPAKTYKWSTGDTTQTIFASNAGKYTLGVINSNGCALTAEKTIIFNPKPDADYVVKDSCANTPISFADKSKLSAGVIKSWEWRFNGAGANSSLQNPVHSFVTGGNYPVELIVTTEKGCRDTLKRNLKIIASPDADFIFTKACSGQLTGFLDKSVDKNGGAINAWAWDFGDGTKASKQIAANSFKSPAQYKVLLTVKNTFGCSDTLEKIVDVNETPKAEYSYTGLCDSTIVPFYDQSTIKNGSIVAWAWDFGNNAGTINLQNPKQMMSTGTKIIKLKVTSDKSCSDSISKNITPNPLPVVNFKVSSEKGCSPHCVSFTDLTVLKSGTKMKWLWNLGGKITGEPNPEYCFVNKLDSALISDIKLTVTSSEGCTSTKISYGNVKTQPVPKVVFTATPDNVPLLENNIEVKNFTNIGDRWYWDFGDSTTSTLMNPDAHVYKTYKNYNIKLKVETSYGCVDSAFREVIISPDYAIFVPNSFTPNDDGTNDIFIAKGSLMHEYDMKIYDRWGKLIFNSANIDIGWDGKIKNMDAPEGTYVYRITIKDMNKKKHYYKGSVTLVR